MAKPHVVQELMNDLSKLGITHHGYECATSQNELKWEGKKKVPLSTIKYCYTYECTTSFGAIQ